MPKVSNVIATSVMTTTEILAELRADFPGLKGAKLFYALYRRGIQPMRLAGPTRLYARGQLDEIRTAVASLRGPHGKKLESASK